MNTHPREGIDRLLLLEISLTIGLVALGMIVFWMPAAEGRLDPRWWHWIPLGFLFFTILALRRVRLRHRGQAEFRRAIREDLDIGRME